MILKIKIVVFAFIISSFTIFPPFTAQTPLLINPKGTTLSSRFNTPANYIRVSQTENSFASYLNSFPLKDDGTKVYLYNGNEKNKQDVHTAVLDIDIGNKDLQQCADAVIRLRAEYLYKAKQFDKLHFNFTNGFNAEFSKWVQGYRIKVNGNKTNWYLATKPSSNVEVFMQYLEVVFSYAGTLSLSKELKSKSVNNIAAGDVFIFGGSPGHAVIVMDVAIHIKTKERIFMIAQSYMPAQNIHVLKNLNDTEISPWYKLKGDQTLKTPEWIFYPGSLFSFE